MTDNDILFSKFAGPAMIIAFNGKKVRVVSINDKLLPEFGMNVSKEDFKALDILESFAENDRRVYLNTIKRCISKKSEETCNTERTLTSNCCGNEDIFVRSRFVYLEERDGENILFEEVRNISAEKKLEEAPIDSEKLFKIASDQVNIYYWEYTVATKEMRPCFRCMRDLGLPALVKNYPEPAIEAGIFPQDYADMYRDWHRQIAEGVKELEAEIPLTVGRVPFRVKYTTTFDAEGKPYKAYGSATLISERELKKNRLDNSIIETLANEYGGIFLVDLEKDEIITIKAEADGETEAVNNLSYVGFVKKMLPMYSEQYNRSGKEFLDLEFLRKGFFKKEERKEYNIKSKKTNRWIRLCLQCVEKNKDAASKMLIAYSEIDDSFASKIDADTLIAKQKKELEEKQEQLVKAVAEANSANRAKSDFLAKMSHEIRTPMNAIMGMNEIILQSAEDENIRNYANDAYTASKGLLETINEILDFSKIESGKMEIIEEEYNLGNLIGNLYNLFAMRAEDKNLSLVFNIDKELPKTVVGDEMHLRQVVTNLLSNAVKYTDEGSVTLNVKCIEKTAVDSRIRFEVIDTGQGIRKEDMGKLLEAFERIDEKKNRNVEGTGLGMSIATKLLHMMGSNLEIESEYQKGSTFAFTIRQVVKDFSPVDDYQHKIEESTDESGLLLYQNESANILVVDDNAVNLKVISALLRGTKCRITSVNSGKKALEEVANNKFDLIFLDHYMPEMDGIETLKQIRRCPMENVKTPIIALTANAIKGADEEYRALGFDDVVYKPAGQKELNEILWKFLG